MTVFFCSDMHIGSKNIISYCNRPFTSVEEMDNTIISNYNSRVKKSDIVYFLGDNVWGHQNYESIFSQLNGAKHIVLGNHDNKQGYEKLQKKGIVQSISYIKNIQVDNKHVVLCHYPMRSWNRSFHGSYMLYGHVHNRLPDYSYSTDVGVDKWNFYPVSFEELVQYFDDRILDLKDNARDNHDLYKRNFEDFFVGKYKERISKEAEELSKLLEEKIKDFVFDFDSMGDIPNLSNLNEI